MGRHDDPEVVFIERGEGGSALRWLVIGAVVGAGLALLFAPQSGEATRRDIRRRARRVRDLAEEAVGELKESFGAETGEDRARSMADSGGAYDDADLDEDLELAADDAGTGDERTRRPERPSLRSARDELERRLQAARTRRRRQPVPDDEEPVA